MFIELFTNRVELLADKHPESGRYLLPPCYTRAEFYEIFISNMSVDRRNFGISTFYKLWNKFVS